MWARKRPASTSALHPSSSGPSSRPSSTSPKSGSTPRPPIGRHDAAPVADDGLGLALERVDLEALMVEPVYGILEAPVVAAPGEGIAQECSAAGQVLQQGDLLWSLPQPLAPLRPFGNRGRLALVLALELAASLMLEGQQAASWRPRVVAYPPVVLQAVLERDEPAAAATAIGPLHRRHGSASPTAGSLTASASRSRAGGRVVGPSWFRRGLGPQFRPYQLGEAPQAQAGEQQEQPDDPPEPGRRRRSSDPRPGWVPG